MRRAIFMLNKWFILISGIPLSVGHCTYTILATQLLKTIDIDLHDCDMLSNDNKHPPYQRCKVYGRPCRWRRHRGPWLHAPWPGLSHEGRELAPRSRHARSGVMGSISPTFYEQFFRFFRTKVSRAAFCTYILDLYVLSGQEYCRKNCA